MALFECYKCRRQLCRHDEDHCQDCRQDVRRGRRQELVGWNDRMVADLQARRMLRKVS